ncbi:RsbRD N-terminal domain-containing protein [Desulforhopalus vacuolatus]|uniref:RsbRD N-terminal domain-containing protein n=1 Tax=Desulforhopalus vacuolatus TaxID=40414 RepID=UPI001962BBE5|nr:RsbRD N-terminal domain-containing protein [Desulforhopalus vacuolatus]MBM9519933.1 RsbRD N-terminal domain-containing protein [Desulforhopalus vacuolatus]
MSQQQFDLAEGFRKHQEEILARWVEYTLSTYESSDFFKKEKNQFANPIGGNVRIALGELLPLLIKGAGRSAYEPPLERIISIRAVQQFTPAQAVSPLNAIKHITREILAADPESKHLNGELYDFDFAVDIALLAAFDIYMQFRERIYSVRIREIKSGSIVLTDSKCPSKLLKPEGEIPMVQAGI